VCLQIRFDLKATPRRARWAVRVSLSCGSERYRDGEHCGQHRRRPLRDIAAAPAIAVPHSLAPSRVRWLALDNIVAIERN
jgi:hypothetical protein